MRAILIFAVLSALPATLLAQDTAQEAYTAQHALVLRDDGFYILAPDSATLVKVASGKIIDQRTGSTDPDPGPDDPTPPGDDLNARAQKLSVMTNSVSDPKVGTALSTVCRSLYDTGLEGDAARQAFDTAFSMVLNTVKGTIPADWAAWKVQVTAVATETNWDKEFLNDLSAGIADAFDAEDEVEAATYMVKSQSLVETSGATPADDGQLDIGKIIALIIKILELLRDLGILD